MDLKALLEKAFLDGYATSDLDIGTMFLCVGLTAVIGLYIYIVYKQINRNSFYNRNFALSLITLAIITSAIILTIQSNIVVSLGMVGALSIVRFRTAIKDPMDLVFLFWSISAGIICGAGFAMIAVIASIMLTIVIVLISILYKERENLVLVVNADDYIEEDIIEAVSDICPSWKVRARNLSGKQVSIAIEVRTFEPERLIGRLREMKGITAVSLLEHDGEVTA